MAEQSNLPKVTINRYNIYRDGKEIFSNIIGWQTALARARNWATDLFNQPRKIEILNIWTGEILSLEEAEEKTKQYLLKKRQNRVNSGTEI